MNDIFLDLFNISMMASWFVLAIILIRIIFKRIPKSIYCGLWGLVGLRLILPFSIESTLSLIPSSNVIDTTIHQSRPIIQTGIEIVDNNINNYISTNYFEGVTVQNDTFNTLISILSIIWIIGMILMLLYSVYTTYKLNKQVQASILYRDNVYLCDDIDTPFILGIFNPKIYIPSYLDENQIIYVLKHEQAHLIRKDHFYKPIAFALLNIYWFNPILWIAYILLCRDIEAACDEKVIKDMDVSSKKEYSETLFNCSVQRNMIMACPLAFGEVGVKERIKSIINYKKPSFWILLVSLILCICLSIGFLTVPRPTKIIDIKEPTKHTTIFENVEGINFIEDKMIYVLHNNYVEELLTSLKDIEINKKPISQSRSEDRDKTYQFGLLHKEMMQITINVSNDFSSLWIDDGVKPTFSYKIKNPQLMEEIIKKYHLNRVDDIEGIDSFITKTILDNNHISSSQDIIKSGSYIDLACSITSDKIIKRYVFVLYEEYKIENNELIELNSQYIPTIITYLINSNEEFVLKDYWALNDFDMNQSIKDVFPKGIVYDEFDQELYIKILKDENLDKVEDALFKHNKKIIVDNIVKDIKKYDNGYTDKDYFNAKGEGCLHPRLQYESKDIKIEIWSDPHRLFCYVVKINDLNSSAKENIYIDSKYYEALQKELEKYDLVRSYI